VTRRKKNRDEGASRLAALQLLCFVFLPLLTVSLIQAQQEGSSEELYQRGVATLKAGKLDEALEAFEEILARPDGKSPFVHFNLGIIYEAKGNYGDAAEQFRQAVLLKPDYETARMLLGASLMELGQYQEAITEFSHIVDGNPEAPKALLQMAIAHEKTGNIPAAVERLRTLGRIEPKQPEHAYRLGKAYVELSAWATRRMIEIDHDAARVHQVLGENYLTQGKLNLAVSQLRRATELAPDTPGIHWSLAQAYAKQGNQEAALRAIEEELRIVPNSVMAVSLKKRLLGNLPPRE